MTPPRGVYIENRPGLPLDVAALASAQLELTPSGGGPQVLIMHTHGSEAYTPDGEDVYLPAGNAARQTRPTAWSGWGGDRPGAHRDGALGDP